MIAERAGAGLALVGCDALVGGQRKQAAQLALEALEDFYGRLRADADSLVQCISAELGLPGTELENAIAAVDGNQDVCGIMCSYPADELNQRQMASTFHLASGVETNTAQRLFAEIGAHAKSIPALPGKSYYLARFAVKTAFRGQGLADQLLLRFAALGSEFDCLSLHVLASNARAIAFYRKRGFEAFGESDRRYLCMHAELETGSAPLQASM